MTESNDVTKVKKALADAPGYLFYGVTLLLPPVGVWWAYKMPQTETRWKRRLGLSVLWLVFFVGTSLNSYFERQAGERGATQDTAPASDVPPVDSAPQLETPPVSIPSDTTLPPAETSPEPAPAAVAAKVEAPVPPELTPDEKLLAALVKEVGKRKIRVDEYEPPTGKDDELTVAFNVGSFFSTIDMKTAITDILRTLRENGFEGKGVNIKGYTDLVDKFGNATNEVVLKVRYSRETIERINFENFDWDNVFDLAEPKSLWQHPAVKK